MDNLKTPSTNNGETSNSATPDLQNPNHGESLNTHEPQNFFDEIDSSCSTPYVSAPSSPGRGSSTTATTHIAFFYSAPASPMHVSAFPSTMSSSSSSKLDASVSGSFEFEFSGRFASNGSANGGSSMSSADELFLNGQIRPMKLSTHLQRPQMLAPLIDLEDEDEIDTEPVRGRDLRLRDKSLRRRTRSLSPLRNTQFQWHHEVDDNAND
ncbi:hypothetical protein L1049_019291 [Liquidambar formosana]|uniref:Uncharacterized protein n=1 Tax=Liquidambar formosana TaxID=63359 RepID=A0AAP0S5J5_LIQFO